MQTSVIRDLGELESVSAEWDALLDRSAAPEVFRTPDWMAAWWEVFGDGGRRQPLAVLVRQGPTLVGLAPFAIHQVSWRGRVGLRRLGLMGTGEDQADEVCSYFGDIIAAPGFEEAVCERVWQFLQENRALWDVADFPAILESSLLARLLRPAAHDGGRPSAGDTFGRRFYMDLQGGSFAGFLERLSKKMMKRFESYRRKLEKEGIAEERLLAREEIPGFLDEMSRLNRYAGTVYGYRIGFDSAAFGSVSPGLVAIGQSIEWAFASGCTRFDFLVSGDGSYEEDYPCLTEPVLDLTVYNDTTAGRLLRLARQARDALRDVRGRLIEVRQAA